MSNPKIKKLGITKLINQIVCSLVSYKYDTLPDIQNSFEIFLYDNNPINPLIMLGNK